MATEDDGSSTDCISHLSDDLLHTILLHLNSTPDAARTSVLSRRWRSLWSAVPSLSFPYHHHHDSPTHTLCRRIDQALASSSAPTLHRLHIAMPRTTTSRFLPLHHHANGWLRFASQRLSGELYLSMPSNYYEVDDKATATVLPPCVRATSIHLDLNGNTLRFVHTTTFTSLSTLRIENAQVDSLELQHVVSSSHCPNLKDLVLGYVCFLHGSPSPSGFSIRSDSLERLEIFGAMDFRGRLEVDAPKLRFFSPRFCLPEHARIVAPMLSEVRWYGYPYDPVRHKLVGVGRRLRRLDVQTDSPAAALMKPFDTVHDLNLTVNIEKGKKHYHKFLKNIDNVPKCEILLVRFIWKEHAFMSTMLYLLKKCAWIRKLEVFMASTVEPSCSSHCPCCFQQASLITDSITLDSLKEVEIYFFGGSTELLELIALLSTIAVILEKIIIRYESSSAFLLSKEVCKEVHSMCHPNIRVEFTVLSCRKRVAYDANKI